MSRAGRAPHAFGFAVRLARREVRRRPLRTVLVALLVAAPVVAMTVAAVMLRTNEITPAEEWRQVRGRADAVVHGSIAGYTLPQGTRTTSFRQEHLAIRTASGMRWHVELTDLSPEEPLAEGVYRGVAGRAPRAAGEVMLSRHLAKRLGAVIGDRVELVRPMTATLTVVGIADRTQQFGGVFLVLARTAPFPDVRTAVSTAGARPTFESKPAVPNHLVDLPDDLPAAELATWARSAWAAYGEATKEGSGSLSLGPPLRDLADSPPEGVDAGYVPPADRGVEQVAWSWVIGAGVLTVVGIVIASAFAAGSRRQLTTLGQLAANGAGQRVLRRVLLLQGTWTGIVGAVLGLAGGAVALALLDPHRYRLVGRDTGPYRVRPIELVPIVVLAVLTATLAALVPARTASRTPVLNALAGRRPLGAVPGWLAPAGIATAVGGLALLALAVIGSAGSSGSGPGGSQVWAVAGGLGAVAILLGSCAVAPRYVSVLDRFGSRLRGSWRFAARSLARQRTRTAAVVAAVCVTTALSVSASALVISASELRTSQETTVAPNVVHVRSGEHVLQPGGDGSYMTIEPPAALVAAILREVPDAAVVRIPRVLFDAKAGEYAHAAAVAAGSPRAFQDLMLSVGNAAIATPEAERLYRLDDRARHELATVGAVAFAPTPGHVSLPPKPGKPAFTVRVLPDTDHALGALPPLLMTAERARLLGWTPAVPALVIEAPRPLTAGQRAGVSDAYSQYLNDAADDDGLVPMAEVHFYMPSGGPDPLALQGLLAAGALLFTIAFVAISLALASAETRDERDALSVVGAGTRVLRRTSGRKALIVTFLGATLGLPVGLLPVAVFTRVDADGLSFVVPWAVLALLVAVVPAVAGLVTTFASGLALRLRPVRVSTMTFE